MEILASPFLVKEILVVSLHKKMQSKPLRQG